MPERVTVNPPVEMTRSRYADDPITHSKGVAAEVHRFVDTTSGHRRFP